MTEWCTTRSIAAAVAMGVKGGEKMYRVGGSTGVFGLSTFSVNVRANWLA